MARGPAAWTDAGHRIDYGRVAWESPNPKMRHKVAIRRGRRMRVVELERGYEEPGWCAKGHVVYVLEGEGVIDFDGAEETFHPGDAILIPQGPAHRHRITPTSDRVRLFVVDAP